MTDDLATRLAAALDRAEAAAKSADQGPWGVGTTSGFTYEHHGHQPPGTLIVDSDGEWPKPFTRRGSHVYSSSAVAERRCSMVATLEDCGHREGNADHIAAWNPAMVLRLIERDRALLAEYEVAGKVGLAWIAFEVLHREVDRAAAFWMPEATDVPL